jgi:tetratricopeptide (TPR) repeat protein
MSVINQMLKDLEQRRTQGFDGEGGILGGLAAGSSQSGRDRGLKLVVLLLIIMVVLLAWLLWERFSQSTVQVTNIAAQEPVAEIPIPPGIQAVNKIPASMPEPAPVKTVAQPGNTDSETAQATVVDEKPAPGTEKVMPVEVITASKKTPLSINDSQPSQTVIVARIDRIAPAQFVATGERTVMRVYGEGFIPPFEVLLEWSGGRGFKVLDDWQVELISEREMHVHFNPGTQDDDWAVRVERRDGASSERFAFKVNVPASEIAPAAPPVAVTAKPQATLSKTRRTAAPAEQAASLFARASGLLKNGQAGEAEQVLRKVLALDAGHTRARELLASLLFHNQQHAEAAEILEAGIAQRPGHIPFNLLLARVRMEQGRDLDAITVLESQKPLARDYSDYYALLAALYQRVARHADAARIYQGLVEVFPGRAVWWMGLGISLQSLDKPAGALTAYRRALKAQGLQPELKKFVQQRIRLLGG